MRRILVAPDSYKGTLTPSEASEAIAQGVRSTRLPVEITLLPVSDGGDGFLEALSFHRALTMGELPWRDLCGRQRTARYGLDREGICYLESAQIIGLHLLTAAGPALLHRSTAPLGGLLATLSRREEIKQIALGLGGTATCDLGLGALWALGWKFTLAPAASPDCMISHTQRGPTPFGFPQLIHIEPTQTPLLKPLHFLVDVDNPLLGSRGAVEVFAPQKGASSARELGLLHRGFSRALELLYVAPESFADSPGFGAAGGFPALFVRHHGATLSSGARALLEAGPFMESLPHCDLVITGEGAFDEQSLSGKITGRIVEECQKRQIPFLVLSGLPTDLSRVPGGTVRSCLGPSKAPPESSDDARALLATATRHALQEIFPSPCK